ncbi:MAG: exonuclease domain-containing protein [Bacteroidota bacterium]
MYAIVDIETTGGNTNSDRITEIAILLHDGEKVVEEFSTLVNPGRRIPYRISSITGITNDMVRGAPKFFEVAKQIVELTEGHTFVAHNAKFDYNFIRNAFRALGFDFKRKKLCTVELSRSLIPGLKSYKLGQLCKRLDIPTSIQHRAKTDAQATARLLEYLLQLRENRTAHGDSPPETRLSRLGAEANLHKELIDNLPHETGVYYFYNADRQLIYVGKSVDIRSRVLSHFNNNTTTKALEMKQAIAHIRYAVTGSELVALLKESEEIKRFMPVFNRAQRRTEYHAALFADYDENGYLHFRVERLRHNGPEPVALFSTMKGARGFLDHMIEEYELCQTLCGLHRISGSCFYHSIHKCRGACVGQEYPISYNLRAEKVLDRLVYRHENLLIVDQGRHAGEKSLVLVERGKYVGYGFIEAELVDNEIDVLRHVIQPYMDNKDVRQIIKLYLRQQKAEAVVAF